MSLRNSGLERIQQFISFNLTDTAMRPTEKRKTDLMR
jgi:hypothetical protein